MNSEKLKILLKKYLPIKIQNMISDCLGNIWKFNQLKLLEEFEIYKYDKLYQTLLLDDGIPRLNELSTKLKEQARTRNKGEDTTEINEEDNKIVDVNEIAIQKLENDILSLEGKLSISIRKVEDRLDSIIQMEKEVCKQNYGELNIFSPDIAWRIRK